MRIAVLDSSQSFSPTPPGPMSGTFLQERGPVNYGGLWVLQSFLSSELQLGFAACSSWDLFHSEPLIKVLQKQSSQYMLFIDSKMASCRDECHQDVLVYSLQSPYLNHKLLLEPFLQPSEADCPSKDWGASLTPLIQAPLCSPFYINSLLPFSSPSSGWDESEPLFCGEKHHHAKSWYPRSPLSTLSSSVLSTRASLISIVRQDNYHITYERQTVSIESFIRHTTVKWVALTTQPTSLYFYPLFFPSFPLYWHTSVPHHYAELLLAVNQMLLFMPARELTSRCGYALFLKHLFPFEWKPPN